MDKADQEKAVREFLALPKWRQDRIIELLRLLERVRDERRERRIRDA